MKNIFLLFIGLAFFTLKNQAQTNIYHPFPTSNAVWSVYYSGYQSPWCYDRQYFIAGDTIVNTMTYHQVKYFGWHGSSNGIGECDFWNYDETQIYLGAFREDTAQRKVYFLLPSYSTDTLLYDFSLNVGDTLPLGINNGGSPVMTINSIDSILINGNYRKRFEIANTSNVSIIEGIGSTTGLIEKVLFFESGGNLYCYSENNQEIYPTNSSSPCDLLLSESELTKKKDFNIYPNPATDKISIDCAEKQNLKMQLYNIVGKCIFQKEINNITKEIDISTLSKGVYIIKIFCDDWTVQNKLIKE